MSSKFTTFVRPALVLTLALLGAAGFASPARAQEPGDEEPCCPITAIDARSGMVTAADASTGRTFQFKASAAQIRGLRVGNKVWADFGAQRVSLNESETCCGMTNVRPAKPAGKTNVRPAAPVNRTNVRPPEPAANPAQGEVNPSEVCCGITVIDARSGVVTARVNATGRTFQFTVADRATLQSLRAGQGVWANFGTNRVRIYGSEVCCPIVMPSVRPE